MKKLLLFAILITAIPLFSNAQYQSIFGSSSTSWNIAAEVYVELQRVTDSVVAGNDTSINALNYKKIHFFAIDHFSGLPPVLENTAYVREDLTLGKGWIAILLNPIYETVFYDLSLSVGDPFMINGSNYPVDSVYVLDGRKHIRITYEYPMMVANTLLIQGD